ncbi:hypothetical protein [Halorussus litoreus]|uniref:hypothetical protein n=1 Tax=Halorussus litoreus TaxID=1710536 RepID=UPI00130085A3|nr:hypothetical protein [Halorussus litoreus]
MRQRRDAEEVERAVRGDDRQPDGEQRRRESRPSGLGPAAFGRRAGELGSAFGH